MPIPIGVLAQAGAGIAAANAYDLIQTINITGSSTTNATFNNLNTLTQYRHLQVRWVAQANTTSTSATLALRMNNDGGSNYSGHYLQGEGGSGASSTAFTNQSFIRVGEAPGSQDAPLFSSGTLDLLDFLSNTKNKTTKAAWQLVNFSNPYYRIGFYSGVWRNTNSITTLSFDVFGLAFLNGSRFSLYGIR